MSSRVVVEGPTLEACRAEAARQLHVPAERLSFQILQHGKQGFFSNKPFRVMASERSPAPAAREDAPASPMLSKLDAHVRIALAEMERLEILKAGRDGQAFNEILSSYDQLSDERRQEVVELSKLLSGPAAKKVQERIAKDGWFSLRVAPDKMSAVMDVHPPEGIGKPINVHHVLQRLRDEGVTYGIDHVRIRKLLEEVVELGRPINNITVAKGTPAQPGADGAIEHLVDLSGKEEVVRGDGSVDHRGKARICVVKAGQPLARIVPPIPGKPGMNVSGQPIAAAAGRTAVLAGGENVTLAPETGEYRADIDGIVEIDGGGIRVRQSYIVSGDVDMSTGNIDFTGTVQVLGAVRDGFSVRATGDIEVRGGVEGCEIVSAAGSIRVRQGIAGRHRCFISAGRDVEAKYIENARVYARNDIKVEVAIMHSEVVAGNAVLATKGKGAIIGGLTKAGVLVHARTLGAANEPVTEFLVGISIEEQDQIRDMDQRAVALRNSSARVEGILKEFEHAARDVSRLPARDKERYLDMKKKLLVIHYEIDKVEAQRKEFVQKITAQARGTVKVSYEAYGRVVVKIGQFVDQVDQLLHAVTFRADPEARRLVRDRYTA